jgi:catechol 2,3-dioxygenase-like lactoylglutathione lyase family enzyme
VYGRAKPGNDEEFVGHIEIAMPDAPAAKKYDVGSLLLDRPFKIRRLGHFGFDNVAMTQSLTFYTDLLGFRLSDTLDFNRVARDKNAIEGLGDTNGYMLRYGTDHHAFALFPRRVRQALNHRANTNPDVTTNQITFQVGSLRLRSRRSCRRAFLRHRADRLGRAREARVQSLAPLLRGRGPAAAGRARRDPRRRR